MVIFIIQTLILTVLNIFVRPMSSIHMITLPAIIAVLRVFVAFIDATETGADLESLTATMMWQQFLLLVILFVLALLVLDLITFIMIFVVRLIAGLWCRRSRLVNLQSVALAIIIAVSHKDCVLISTLLMITRLLVEFTGLTFS